MAPRMTDFGRKHPSRCTARTTQTRTFKGPFCSPNSSRLFISRDRASDPNAAGCVSRIEGSGTAAYGDAFVIGDRADSG